MRAVTSNRLGRALKGVLVGLVAITLVVGVPAVANADEPTASISGTVQKVDGSLGAEAVTVALYRQDGSAWVYVADAQTPDDYSFEQLPLGTYTLSYLPFDGSAVAGQWYGAVPVQSLAKPLVLAAGNTALPLVKLNYAGSIAGTTTTSTGEAILGASVTAYQTVGGARVQVSATETDPFGGYRLDGLNPGTYDVDFHAQLGSTAADRSARVSVASEETTTQDMLFAVPVTLSGTVRDSDGVSAPEAKVKLSKVVGATSTIVSTATVPTSGAFSFANLPAGNYTLHATLNTTAADMAFSLADGGDTNVDVELPRLAAVAGTLTDSSAAAVPGAKVTVWAADGTAAGTATTAGDGAFRIIGLAPGVYTVSAKAGATGVYLGGSTGPTHATYFALAANELRSAADLHFLTGSPFSGTVKSSTGAIVAGATVTLHASAGSIVGTVVSDSSGRYTLGTVTPGSYFIGVTAPVNSGLIDAAPAGVSVGAAAVVRDVTLAKGAVATGTVLTSSKAAASGATVSVYKRYSTSSVSYAYVRDVTTAASGAFTISGLPAGSYTFAAHAAGSAATTWFGGTSAASPAAYVTLAAGVTTSVGSFVLPSSVGAITGTITAPDVDAWTTAVVTVSGISDSKFSSTASVVDGGYSLTGLPDGTYSVSVRGLAGYAETWAGAIVDGVSPARAKDAATLTVTGGAAVVADITAIPTNASAAGAAPGVPDGTIVTALRSFGDGTFASNGPTATVAAGRYHLDGLVVDARYVLKLDIGAAQVEYFGGPALADADQFDASDLGTDVNISIVDRGGIQGTVVDGSGAVSAVSPDGTTVTLLSGSATPTPVATTKVTAGAYAFSGILPGTYTLRFGSVDAVGAYFAPSYYDEAATPAGAAPLDVVGGAVTTADETALAGALVISGIASATLSSGSVARLADVAVTLRSGGVAIATRTTDAVGGYAFAVAPGDYTVCVSAPTAGPYAGLGLKDRCSAVISVSGMDAGATDIILAKPAALKTLTAGTPVITSTPAPGYTLGISRGTWTAGTVFAYQWFADGVPVSGATGATFAPSAAFTGKAITVRVSGSLAGYTAVDKVSAATLRVPQVSTPTVSGTPAVGFTLTAVPGSWTSGTTLAYQWYAGGVAISGAKSATYKLTSAQAGKGISVRVIGAKSGYATVAKYSATSLLALTWSTPTLSGTVAVGAVLTANAGTWTSGTALSYQWYANGVLIPGATARTFALTSAQAGLPITVRVTGVKAGYPTLMRPSAGTVKVLTVGTVTIGGAASIGATLTAKSAGWTSGTKLTYAWLADGAAISGASKSTFVVTSAQVGKAISVRMTGVLTGYGTTARTSPATTRVPLMPVPAISGTPVVGRTLTAVPNTWTSGTTFAYQWYANGVALAGATGKTHVLTAAEEGRAIALRITGTKSGYTTVARGSAATLKVIKVGTPTLSNNSPQVGQTVSANPGAWTSGTTLTYQWYLAGAAVAGATKSSFGLSSASYAGKALSVRVIGSKSGFPTVTTYSASSKAVVLPASTSAISGTWNCPSWAPIKGNASSKIYHMPGQRYYSKTNPEYCFSSESAAVKAGYRKSKV